MVHLTRCPSPTIADCCLYQDTKNPTCGLKPPKIIVQKYTCVAEQGYTGCVAKQGYTDCVAEHGLSTAMELVP